jgi:hypothetical protein
MAAITPEERATTLREILAMTLAAEKKTFGELHSEGLSGDVGGVFYDKEKKNRCFVLEQSLIEPDAFMALVLFLARKNVDIDDFCVESSLGCSHAQALVEAVVSTQHQFKEISLNNTLIKDEGAVALARLLLGEAGSRLERFNLQAELGKKGLVAIAEALNARCDDYMPALDLNLDHVGTMELEVFAGPLCKGTLNSFQANGMGVNDLKVLALEGPGFEVNSFCLGFDFKDKHLKEVDEIVIQLKENFSRSGKYLKISRDKNEMIISFDARYTLDCKETADHARPQSNAVLTAVQTFPGLTPVTASVALPALPALPILPSLNGLKRSSPSPSAELLLGAGDPHASPDAPGQESQTKKARTTPSPKKGQ